MGIKPVLHFFVKVAKLWNTRMNTVNFMIKACTFLLILLMDFTGIKAQPIPVEVMFGQRYGAVNLAFSRNFSQESRLGFFHMNTVEFNYKDPDHNSFILQDLLYVETIKYLRVTGGVAYSNGGFAPTAGLQYVYAGSTFFFLCAPRVNIQSEPSYDIMTLFQYTPPVNDRVKLYTGIKFLNIFDAGGNIKSYQWIRLGLGIKHFQFGLAFHMDEYGPHPSVRGNMGVFARKEIF
jgi:hypothetical protein